MSYFSKRALRWAAPVALVGALGLAACGDNDDTEAVRVAAPSVAGLGSDQHLNNAADEVARAQRANEAASARLAGEAERQAHLEGQARTYGNLSADAAEGLAEEQAAAQADARRSAEAGYRAAQRAQADAYVDSLEARAAAGQAASIEAADQELAEHIERQKQLDGQETSPYVYSGGHATDYGDSQPGCSGSCG
jgi:hypothetical protein